MLGGFDVFGVPMNSCISRIVRCLPVAVSLLCASQLEAAEKIKALIVDGQNNHQVWPKSTVMMKQYLEETGQYEVSVERVRFLWNSGREKEWLPRAGAREGEEKKDPIADPDFSPDFSKYAVVVSNFGWNAAGWPEATRKNFEKYMAEGGALVVVHAANNSWPEWAEFNKMIGLGGWGNRSAKDGPYVYINDKGEVVRDPQPGPCGKHGPQNEFVVTIRDKEHPITKGLPDFWMHSKDECYSHLRGPAENLTVLATACDTPELQKAGRHEPILMVIQYGKGRVFHTTLGHDTDAFEGVGFIETFLRGTEWAATGKVTRPVPQNFPTAEKPLAQKFEYKEKSQPAK